MAEAFLRKRKHKVRVPSAVRPAASTPTPATAPAPTPARRNPNITEIKLFSSFGGDDRYNIMRLNSSTQNVDITQIPGPLLLNRKDTDAEQQAKLFAYDESGAVVGKYVYDHDGKAVLDAEGKHVIEIKEKADASLIGGPERPKKSKKGVKEVYHQDREIMRLRREETVPWVLESKTVSREAAQRGEGGRLPVHWTGHYQEPASLPTVLFLNNGNEPGFRVVPLGRSYKFEPDRPFKPIGVDEANRMYEQKSRGVNRWSHRDMSRAGTSRTAEEHAAEMRQNQRAERFASGITVPTRVKQERYEDDERREGRGLQRGMEGGADEELDYDEAQDFQDDDDVNTFYHNADEEEEAKLQDENLKRQYRLANANVGDRPQISELSDEETPDRKGKGDKKLARMVKKAMEYDNMLDSDDSSSDEEEEKKEEKKEEPKEEERKLAPWEKHRRKDRETSSPTPRARSPVGKNKKSSTAPPSASFVAQRAASPSRTSRGPSPARTGSKSPAPSGRQSPAPAGPSSPSPMSPAAGSKRKQSPAPAGPSTAAPAPKKKKKAGSKTPTPGPEDATFPGAIQRQEIIDYFNDQKSFIISMGVLVKAFTERLKSCPPKHVGENQKLFLAHMNSLADKQNQAFELREQYRQRRR